MSTSSKAKPDHDRQRDIRRLAKILRSGDYSYDQSKHLVAEARKAVGLTPPKRRKGNVERLTSEEVDTLLDAAYEDQGPTKGLMVRALLETATRASVFCQLRAEAISFREREIEIVSKGDKRRAVPIRSELASELRQHLGGRGSGYLFLATWQTDQTILSSS